MQEITPKITHYKGIEIYEYSENNSSRTLLYIHGFKSRGTSRKVKVLAQVYKNSNLQVKSFSFRGNSGSVSDRFSFSDMTIETQVEDLKTMFEREIHFGNKITPVASSLGAYILAIVLERYSYFLEHIDKIILLAPSLDFAYNIKRQMSKEDFKLLETNGFIKQRHYADRKEVKVNYELYSQAEKNGYMGDIYGELDKEVLLIHDPDEQIVLTKDLEKLKNHENTTYIKGSGGHGLNDNFEELVIKNFDI